MPDVFQSLVFGDHGSGKTRLLGTIQGDERFMPALMLDVDGGADSINSRVLRLETPDTEAERWLKPDIQGLADGKYRDERMDLIHAIRVRNYEAFAFLLGWLSDPKEKGNIYKTIFLDSATTLNDFSLDEIVKTAMSSNLKRSQGRDAPQLDEYGDNLTRMRRHVNIMRNWPVHLFWTALVDWEKDEQTLMYHKWPDFTGKLSQKVPSLFNNVLFLKTVNSPEGPQRKIQFQQDEYVKAKARDEFGKLGFESDIISIPAIWDKMH